MLHFPWHHRFFGLFPLLFMLLQAIFVSAAYASVTSDSEIQKQQARQQADEQESRQKQSQIVLPGRTVPEMGAFQLPSESPCFPIKSIHLEGERLEAFGFVQPYLDRFADQCVGREGLNRILKQAGNLILAHGFTTTRLTLPAQNLTSGTLILHLQPGLIEDVKLVDKSGKVSNLGNWHNAFAFRRGDILNLRDLEQGLEQIKRLPSVDADLKIEPGSKEGQSIVVVTVSAIKPWRLVATLDNSGFPSTGKIQAGLNLAIDNPTGHFDQLTLYANRDTQANNDPLGTHGNSLGYSLPWGNWLGSVTASTSQYHQTIPGTNQTFVSSGESQNVEFKLQRLLHRDQTSKTSLQGRLIRQWSHSYIDGSEIKVQRRDTTAVELAVVHRQYLGAAQIDAQLAQRQGVSWFGGQTDAQPHDPTSPTFAYTLNTLDLSLTMPLPHAMRYSGQFHGQSSNDVLYATNYMAIGNRWTVRGYSGEYTLADEDGMTLRNDLEFAHWGQGTFYLALDGGQVHGNASLPGHTLTGGGLGLRGQYGQAFYDFFIGAPIAHPNTFPGGPVGYFQLGYQF